MSEYILRLDDVHTDIAQYQILHGITMNIQEGGVYVLLGRNGAGNQQHCEPLWGFGGPGQVLLCFAITMSQTCTLRTSPVWNRLRTREHGHLWRIDRS